MSGDSSLKRLTVVLTLFFVALVMPSGFLIWQAFDQLKWEAFHRHRLMAEETVARLDQRLASLVASQDSLSFTDFSFLNVSAENPDSAAQLSSLSAYPVKQQIPGIMGYFEVSHDGSFSSPHVPQDDSTAVVWGISNDELAARRSLHQRIYELLVDNALIRSDSIVSNEIRQDLFDSVSRDADEGYSSYSQQAFHDLKETRKQESPKAAAARLAELQRTSLGSVDDLQLETTFERELAEKKDYASTELINELVQLRKEQNVLPRSAPVLAEYSGLQEAEQSLPVRIFESAIEPFDFAVLSTGHYLLHRRVWRDQEPFTQGILIDGDTFVSSLVEPVLERSTIARSSDIGIVYQGNVLRWVGNEGAGTLLLKATLIYPFNQMQLIFTADRLPWGESGSLLKWTSAVLALVLCAGFAAMFFIGRRQILLTRQQQDFVSAVSHELKTPLTSIRMYGEMLREGWVSEDKRRTYYDFIFDESERLTRLINNVLQLARINRNELSPDLKPRVVRELLDDVRSKTDSQVRNSGFTMNIDCDPAAAECEVVVDDDYVSQIFINIVDNAIKFAGKSETKQIDIGCRKVGRVVRLSVRDYGPGIERDKLRKIFGLFYRVGNELTRETPGTGIGLSLVHQMVEAMDGEIDVIRQQPGTEFVIKLSVA